MSESAIFRGATKEECQAKAEAFMSHIDKYRQPSIQGPYKDEKTGGWFVSVRWFGLD